MNIQEYISSGIVENYVLGLTDEKETAEFERMCEVYPEVKAAREAFEISVEEQAMKNAITPPPHLKSKIFSQIDVEIDRKPGAVNPVAQPANIENADKNKDSKEMKEMLQAYNEQDLAKLEAMLLKTDAGISSFTDILLYNRNRTWVQKLKELMKNKALVIAVGAGHLPGDQGVIQLLRKEGYKVDPVDNKLSKTKEI